MKTHSKKIKEWLSKHSLVVGNSYYIVKKEVENLLEESEQKDQQLKEMAESIQQLLDAYTSFGNNKSFSSFQRGVICRDAVQTLSNYKQLLKS